MKKNFGKVSLFGLAILGLSLGGFDVSYAQTIVSPRGSVPQIHIIDLVVPVQNVEAGGVVTGTFTLFNNSSNTAPDISYSAILVGEYQNNQPTVVYNEQKLGQSFLAAGEKKVIPFEYTLPQTVSGSDLAVRIQAMYGGFYLGWDDARITVRGKAALAEVTSTSIHVGSTPYGAEIGAVVPKGETVSLHVSFSNSTTEDITFTPRVTMYNRISTGELLGEFTSTAVTVGAGNTKNIAINLPTFDYKPLVYAGEAAFLDAAGQPKASLVTFRYMITGDMASIQTVTSQSQGGNAGDVVSVDILYGGAPLDQNTGQATTVGIVKVKVSLFDGSGNKVGEGNVQLDIDAFGNKVTVPVTLLKSASSLKAVATIEKNGSLLAEHTNVLTETKPSPTSSKQRDIPSVLLGLFVVLVIATALLAVIGKMRGTKRASDAVAPPSSEVTTADDTKNMTPPSIGGTMALFIVCSISFLGLVSFPARALAYIETAVKTMGDPIAYPQEYPALFINSPYDNQIISAGSQFNINGRQDFWNCSNESRFDSTIRIGFNGATTTNTFSHEEEGTSSIVTNTFNYGPFAAPITPGTYRIFFRADTIAYGITSTGEVDYSMSWSGWSEGYVDIVVPLPAPVLSSPTEGPGGGSGGAGCFDDIKLTWSTAAGATKYEVYRDGIILAEVLSPSVTYTDSAASVATHSYYIVAVAGASRSSNSNTVSATKCSPKPAIDATVVPSPNPSYPDRIVTWTATPFGACPGPFSYSWTGDDALSGSTRTTTHTYANLGNYFATVTVSAPNCLPITKQSPVPLVVTTQPTPDSITCSGNPRNPKINDTVTWTANATPPEDYTYSWSGDDSLSGNTQTVTKAYQTAGVKNATVSLVGTDDPSSCSATIRVRENPNYQEI